MTSPDPHRSLSPNGLGVMAAPLKIPAGLSLPEIIITRRTRTHSMNGRIEDEVHEGTVKFFCRSRGHGFIDDDQVSLFFKPYFEVSWGMAVPQNTLRVVVFLQNILKGLEWVWNLNSWQKRELLDSSACPKAEICLKKGSAKNSHF